MLPTLMIPFLLWFSGSYFHASNLSEQHYHSARNVAHYYL